MIKKMGQKGKAYLTGLFNKIWREERIPEEWEIGLILPIYKSGNRTECGNYREITIIGKVTKLFEKILEKRLRSQVEGKLHDAQSGFRPSRSTQDHIFTLKTIVSRSLDLGRNVYTAFLDMEKAFDRVPIQQGAYTNGLETK